MSPVMLKILGLVTKTLQGEEKTICQHSELRYHLFKAHSTQRMFIYLTTEHKVVIVEHVACMFLFLSWFIQ